MNKFKKILHQRQNFYIGGYIIGYIIGYIFSIIYVGIPNILFLVPIKLSCIICAIGLGNAFYYSSKKMLVMEITFKGVEFSICAGVLIILSVVLEYFLSKLGIDITPFIGM